ncbi:hypothetical protein ACK3TF_005824 [Chlorella vulgaris]
MWPAGLQSPTVYYMLRELDLRIQCVRQDDPAVWRPTSVAGTRPNALLQLRGQPLLAIKLPAAPGSGVQLGDVVVYVRAVQPGSQKPLRPTAFRFIPPASTPLISAAAPGAAAVPTQQRTHTPPPQLQLQQHRIKRIRVSQPAVAACSPPAGENTANSSPPSGGFCFSRAAPLSASAWPHSEVVPWFWKQQELPCPHQQFAAAVATCAAACRAC